MKKQEIEKKHNKMFIQTITLSLIGMFICFGVLCSTSWAWFKDSTLNYDNVITSGSLALTININDVSTNQNTSEDIKGVKEYNLNQGEYKIELSVSPNSTATKGYCIITIGDDIYITDLIEQSDVISLTFKLQNSDTVIEFETIWGYPATSNLFNNNTIIVD